MLRNDREVPAPVSTPVRVSTVVVVLCVVVVVLAVVVALVGLFSGTGGAPRTVTSVRGEAVQVYGRGVYEFDTTFKAAGNRGSDLVTLVVGVPLLTVATVLYGRGSLRGALLLAGALTWPLYLYSTMALGTAYNPLFLAYVTLFGASLYALLLTVRSIDVTALGSLLEPRAPRGRLAALMLVSGLLTAVVWLVPLLASALAGSPPELLGTATTMVTDALDLAVITPATFVAAFLLHRRRFEGYLVAFPLLVLLVLLLPMIAAQSAFQVHAGISFTPGEIVGPIAGFVVLAAVALTFVVALLRRATPAS